MPDILHKREKLEIIVDKCSSGQAVLAGIDKLIEDAKTRRPRIFQDYRITIPIQLDTETRDRVFPEFLAAALQKKNPAGALEEFYQRHRKHIHIVETDVSLGYKWGYVGHAQRLLAENPGWASQVVGDARALAEYYDIPLTGRALPSLPMLQALCARAGADLAEHNFLFGEKRRAIVDQMRSQPHTGPGQIDQAVRDDEKLQINQRAERFLADISMGEKLLIQAMYSQKQLKTAIGETPEFRRFRRNKGERAIESYLFSEHSESDPERVTLIVSEDAPARESIARLRNKSNNTIFVVSSYGLELALNKLGLLNGSHVTDTQIRDTLPQRRALTQQKRQQGHAISMDDMLEPEIEERWAGRLAEIMQTGQWRHRRRREHPRIRGGAESALSPP